MTFIQVEMVYFIVHVTICFHGDEALAAIFVEIWISYLIVIKS